MPVEVSGEYGFWLGLATVIVESIIAVLLFQTVKDYAEVGRASRIEAKQRLRPWVGPSSGIEFVRTTNGNHQYSITIKNFGETPATSVLAMSRASSELPNREVSSDNSSERFNLGPLLPHMEKRYWIFIDSKMLETAAKVNQPIYIIIHFLYEFSEGARSGYGMISEMDTESNTFMHKDMWVEQEISKR